ncbi:MAG: integrase arm-type DNA-binding domain-containing protein [Polaromonas sp.]|nr:integrase arm-type DNA-binding domain-containing protein [Polaromonas sp.]
MYFDARAAKMLQPGQHIVVDGCPGLRLTATKTKKTWTYRFKSPFSVLMKQIKIGSWPEMSPATAADKWQDLRARREGGENLIASKKIDALAVKGNPEVEYTIGQLIEDYGTGHLDKMRQPRGARAIKARLNTALLKYKSLPASAISRRFVFDVTQTLSNTPVLAKSVKTEMGAAWNLAIDSGRINEELPNWWILVKSKSLRSKGAIREGKHKGTGKRILSDDEISVLMRTDMALFSQQVRDFLIVQLWTCTRGAEIVQMQPKHITQESDGLWWTVPKEMTKGRHNENATDLRVPMVGRALEIVNRLRKNGKEWLFPSRSHAGVIGHQKQAYMNTKTNYYQPYGRARPDHIRTRLTVTHWSPHDLRRTGRTLLASIGCPKEIGELILGHVVPGVEGLYNLYAYDKERRSWLEQLDAKLEEIIKQAPAEA